MSGRIVLMYHDIESGPTDRRYSFTADEFRAHLAALAASGAGAPGLPGDGSSASWTITFDDGHPGWLDAAAALGERGWKGVFFTISGAVGAPGRLDGAGVRRLAELGHAVGSHSVDHPLALSSRDDAFILDQWARSKAALEDITGRAVESASVPGGFYAENVARAAEKAGLKHLYTSEPVAGSWRAGACEVHGRYSLTRGMTAADAAALATGARLPRWRQYAEWNLKKAVKKAVLGPYLALRGRAIKT